MGIGIGVGIEGPDGSKEIFMVVRIGLAREIVARRLATYDLCEYRTGDVCGIGPYSVWPIMMSWAGFWVEGLEIFSPSESLGARSKICGHGAYHREY